MKGTGNIILYMGVGIGCLSGLYYLSLLLHLPLVVAIPLILAAWFFLYCWLMPHAETPGEDKRYWWALGAPVLAMAVICVSAYGLSQKYGQLDAWVTWNFHARYLADPDYWAKLFENVENDHPDYPLCLPATIGFFMRLFSADSQVIPFVFSLVVTLCVPLLIYSALYRQNRVVAAVAVLLFAADRVYIAIGVSQYADTLLAFFFLCACVCIDRAAEGRKYVMLAAIFVGCCAWTKNEGVILAGLFLAFYAHVFFSKQHLKYTGIALAVPMLVISIFKLTSNVQNDVMSMQNEQTMGYLLDGERYKLIWKFFTENLHSKFIYAEIGFFLYLAVCIVERKLPGRQMWLVLACMGAYAMVYVITPYPLDWHLSTSQDRLMHQLMPVMVYVIAQRFCTVQLPVSWRNVAKK